VTTARSKKVLTAKGSQERKSFQSEWVDVMFRMLHASMCHTMSTNQQQLCLQSVDVVDHRRVWSAHRRHESTICDIVWMSLQTHISQSVRHHIFWHMPQWPCPARKRFSNDHWRQGWWKLGSRTVVSSTSEALITVKPPTKMLKRHRQAVHFRF